MRARRSLRNLRPLFVLSVILLVCSMVGQAKAAAPLAKDLVGLSEAIESMKDGPALSAVLSNAAGGQFGISIAPRVAALVPAESKILAYEEHAQFLSVTADVSVARMKEDKKVLRRLVFFRPSTWITEVTYIKADGTEHGAARVVRDLCVLKAAETKVDIADNDGVYDVKVTTNDRVCKLQFPPLSEDAGRIAIEDADGKTLVPRRPLPAGILPHGPEGMKLIERWDRNYRDGRFPPWNSGMAAPDLRAAVEKGEIKPCKTVILGCGSGDNAIYLASKGFDVTALDVAPSALGVAEKNAEKAGVKVKWLVADVLNLPDIGTYDLIFDRGCYHNVRYVDAKGFMKSVDQVSKPGTKFFVLSCNRDSAPGIREATMREDFSELFEFEWIRESTIYTGPDGQRKHPSWSVMLRKKG